LCVCYRNVIEDPVENLNTCKKRKSPKSRKRILSVCSSIEQLTLAVEEVCFLISESLPDYIYGTVWESG
jgi:hypothetical protein